LILDRFLRVSLWKEWWEWKTNFPKSLLPANFSCFS